MQGQHDIAMLAAQARLLPHGVALLAAASREKAVKVPEGAECARALDDHYREESVRPQVHSPLVSGAYFRADAEGAGELLE